MAAITRANIAKQLLPGLNAVFGVEYGSVDDQHLPLFEIENSERAFEEEVLFTGFGTAPTKDEGAAVEYDNAQEAWTSRYTMETIALAFSITEEAMEDNLYDTFARVRAKALARAMANTKQVKAANVYNNGFNSAFPGGDNVPLFSASHPTIGAGNFSNTAAVDLSETALENALIAISLYKDDRNILIGSKGVSLHIPPQLQFVAERLLKSPGRVGTTDNDINAIKGMGMLPGGYHVNQRFTDTNAWFIKTDAPNGTKMFIRVPLQTKMEPDFDTGNLRFKARERYAFGWSDWRGWYGSSGAT